MSPLTGVFKRTRTIISKSALNQQLHDDRSKTNDIDDHHQFTNQSSFHSYMSNFRLKFRHIGNQDVRSKFTFSKFDASKAKLPHLTLNNGLIDRYIFANSQTVANDSTDHKKLAKFFVLNDRAPRSNTQRSKNRRSSFCGTPRLRRYSVSGSDLTVASEDLTSSQFAKHCGINVYPEDEDGVFEDDVSILIQQQPPNGPPVHSTVRSSTRSVKSKISIMEETFWTPPPHNDLDRSDEEAMPRTSMDSSNADGGEPYIRPDGSRGRRNSLITFAEAPNVTKLKRDVGPPKHGVRPGRHSSPIPIPSPKPILMQKPSQLFQRCGPPDSIEMPIGSIESPSSSLSLSYTSLMNRSTTSSVSTTLTIPTSPVMMSSSMDDEGDDSSEPPIVAIIMGERQTETTNDRERAPITVKKGRFEVTIGDLPPPEPSRSSMESNLNYASR